MLRILTADRILKVIPWIMLLLFFCFNIVLIILFIPNPIRESVSFREIAVEERLTLTKLADLLYEKKIINSKLKFIFSSKLLGYEKKIKTGIFLIPFGLSNYKIVKKFVEGVEIEVKTVTFIEGLTLRKIAEIASQNFKFSKEEFLLEAHNFDLLKKYSVDNKNLEGYLMPDTYNFFINSNPKKIIEKMAFYFKDFYDKKIRPFEKSLGLSKNEIITLASIIESETNYNQEKPRISGVYHNRLRKKMKLEADPTVKYFIEPDKKLLRKHFGIKNAYNTYLNHGLPPGPICCPSKSSLIAAVEPENHNFLYFVVNTKGKGHVFSETYSKHLLNVQEYRKAQRTKK